MIQRIQTILLLIVFALSVMLMFFPLYEFTDNNGHTFLFGFDKIKPAVPENAQTIKSIIPVGVLIPATSVFALISIFLYKKRKVQKWFCLVTIVLIAFLILLAFFFASRFTTNIFTSVHIKFAGIFPFIELILCYLAYRKIKDDEELVKSYDRIR